ncbi:DUF2585 family protein [Aureispira anguillae]|uniref:DUF2585 family protein n=1 Tax=Aureispira anguillae TaxID=2864201 RepID=A0A915VKJ5_9BACT|nr:DUF2585 family protein [Aureispira anguillae]BDS09694.1 DUF2585 family protein [Aureispira anguillae]
MSQQKNSPIAYCALFFLIIGTAFILQFQGRNWLAANGNFYFWIGDAWSDQNSQHWTDPYSFSHLLHGILFFGILYPLASKISWIWRFNIAVLLEAIWEIAENSATIIERYRDAGALGYTGDSIVNSMGDLFYCGLGFIVAHYLGFAKSVMLFILVEIGLILTIRDSLIINVIMLVYPLDSIREWQAVMTTSL